MKERLLIMNGQKIHQVNEGKEWKVADVEKARGIKPGIYNLYLAKDADTNNKYDGVILHADKNNIYQQVGKNFIRHDKTKFQDWIDVGAKKLISYKDGVGEIKQSENKQNKKLTR